MIPENIITIKKQDLAKIIMVLLEGRAQQEQKQNL
jgi:hypothetical protein